MDRSVINGNMSSEARLQLGSFYFGAINISTSFERLSFQSFLELRNHLSRLFALCSCAGLSLIQRPAMTRHGFKGETLLYSPPAIAIPGLNRKLFCQP